MLVQDNTQVNVNPQIQMDWEIFLSYRLNGAFLISVTRKHAKKSAKM